MLFNMIWSLIGFSFRGGSGLIYSADPLAFQDLNVGNLPVFAAKDQRTLERESFGDRVDFQFADRAVTVGMSLDGLDMANNALESVGKKLAAGDDVVDESLEEFVIHGDFFLVGGLRVNHAPKIRQRVGVWQAKRQSFAKKVFACFLSAYTATDWGCKKKAKKKPRFEAFRVSRAVLAISRGRKRGRSPPSKGR